MSRFQIQENSYFFFLIFEFQPLKVSQKKSSRFYKLYLVIFNKQKNTIILLTIF